MTQPNKPLVSQRAREAAADLMEAALMLPARILTDMRNGDEDEHEAVEAFARFEAETLASLSSEGEAQERAAQAERAFAEADPSNAIAIEGVLALHSYDTALDRSRAHEALRIMLQRFSTPESSACPECGGSMFGPHILDSKGAPVCEAGKSALASTPSQSDVIEKCGEAEPELIERLLDAQQDINLAANAHMDQSLADASALIDEIEPILRAALASKEGQL